MRLIRFGTAAYNRWRAGLPRAATVRPGVERAVAAILRAVRREGDSALARYTARFDGVRLRPRDIRVPAREVREPRAPGRPRAGGRARGDGPPDRGVPSPAARPRLPDARGPAGRCSRRSCGPLDSVGLYVPGGAGGVSLLGAHERDPRAGGGRPPHRGGHAAARARRQPRRRGRARGSSASRTRSFAWAARRRWRRSPTARGRSPRVAKIVGPGNAFVAAAKRQVRGRRGDRPRGGAERGRDPRRRDRGPGLRGRRPPGPGRARQRRRDRRRWSRPRRHSARRFGVSWPRAWLPWPTRRAARRALRRNGAVVLVRDLDEGIAAVNASLPSTPR